MTVVTGDVEQALSHARRLLDRAPRLAIDQARAILEAVPDNATAHYLKGAALALCNRPLDSVAALRQAVRHEPDMVDAWRLLADQLLISGDAAGATVATAQEMRASVHDPRLQDAARALIANDLPVAERLLKAQLREDDGDLAALRMLAEVAGRLGRYDDARTLLEHALAIAPGFAAARHNLAIVHYRQNRPAAALAELDWLLDAEPGNPAYGNLKAAALTMIGDLDTAVTIFEEVLKKRPKQSRVWMSYGHSLKTIGRQADGVTAYRNALALDPRLGEAWWSLANLKTVKFDPSDIAAMKAQLAQDDLADDDRYHLHFALGKAWEDAGHWQESFEHYAEGNRLRRATIDYVPTTSRVTRTIERIDAKYLASRSGQGDPSSDPIFILGMPRSGSTLIEQILSSHNQIEGTQELPDIQAIARTSAGGDRNDYPAGLLELDATALARLGAEYLDRTRIQRRTDRPFFIDKMPNNWLHVPLIHLILPNARIIDARRHPLACGFSNFKQHFARGQGFSYDLTEMGRYYADYVALMDHVDTVLPGRVYRVYYEAMVADAERETRGLLGYLGVEFEAECLRFHENSRAVRTASSEQVRRPIFRDGLDRWRHYEPWLAPLKTALGAALDNYPYPG